MSNLGWDVFVVERDGNYVRQRCIDTVFFNTDCGAKYVYHSLVEHDGYPDNIIVRNSKLHKELNGRDICDYAYEEGWDEDWLEAMYIYPYDERL